MQMREEHVLEVDEARIRAQQLALRPLAAVDEQPIAAAADQRRGRAARSRRRRARRARGRRGRGPRAPIVIARAQESARANSCRSIPGVAVGTILKAPAVAVANPSLAGSLLSGRRQLGNARSV